MLKIRPIKVRMKATIAYVVKKFEELIEWRCDGNTKIMLGCNVEKVQKYSE